MAPTSSTSHVYIDPPLEIATATSQAIQDRLTQADQALRDRQNLIDTEASRAQGAEFAEANARAAADAAETAARINGDNAESFARDTADQQLEAAIDDEADARADAVAAEALARQNADTQERAARETDDINEAAERTAADVTLQTQIDTISAQSQTSGGTALTQLTHNAGAAVISAIGGDGAQTTVLCVGTHGYVDGDYVTITGTANYNGDTPAINVVATNEFVYTSTVNAAIENTGHAATKRLRVASTVDFVDKQHVTVTNDQGELYTDIVNGAPAGGMLTLTNHVPNTWTLTNRASIGAEVSSSLAEVVAIRTAIGSDGTLTAAEAVKWASGTSQNIRAFGAVGDNATDDRAAIQAAIDEGQGSLTHKTILVPPGDYVFSSQVGTGRGTSTLLVNTDNVRITGEPGARFIMRNGCANRLLLIRGCRHVRIEGIAFVYDRADLASATGVQIENSSDVVVTDGNSFVNWPLYGLAITEDTSAFSYTAPTVTFTAGTKRIADPTNPFASGASGVQVGDTITVVNSLYNDGIKHVTAVDAAHGYVTVSETVVNEGAGASAPLIVSPTISFSSDGRMTSNDGGLDLLTPGSTFIVAGSASNNGTHGVMSVSPDGTQVVVSGTPLVTELAGASITVTAVANPSVAVQRATACDDITVTLNHFSGIGSIGLEDFPKVLSRNHTIAFNTFYACGFKTLNGPAMKPGQGVLGCQVVHNLIAHCVQGIQLGNWESMVVAHNLIENGYEFGIPITESTHQKYNASFASLLVYDNDVHYTRDYVTGVLFDPTAPNTIDPSQPVYSKRFGAINVNGLQASQLGTAPDWGPIRIVKNRLTGWGFGLTKDKSLMPIPRVQWLDNEDVGCGTSRVVHLQSRGTVTFGDPVIRNVYTNGLPGTTSWYPKIQLIGDSAYFLPNTKVVSVDPVAQTITMDHPANATSSTATSTNTTGAGFRSAYPDTMQFIGNSFVEANPASAVKTVLVHTMNGIVEDNRFFGTPAYSLQIRGDGTTVAGNKGYKINQAGTNTRSFILINEQGTYRMFRNWLDVAASAPGPNPGGVAASIIAGGVAAGGAGLGGSIYAQLIDNASTWNTVQVASGIIQLDVARSVSGYRTVTGTAAPTTGTWAVGERTEITAPGPGQPSAYVATAAGTPGTWRPTAYLTTQLTGSKAWDPPSVADGAIASTTVTVTGAAVGDLCMVGFASIVAAGWQISGQVTSANTVTAVITNKTGAPVDLPSGTLRALVLQPY